MNILCMDTSADNIALALKVNNCDAKYFVGNDDKKKHNGVLLQYIDDFLQQNDIRINDIDTFGVVVGPGSFTGIRVGVATVNALALGGSKKIVQITSLEQLANNNMVLLDCKHDNFYCGIFTNNKQEYKALTKAEVAEYDIEKTYLNGVYPLEMLAKCLEKANNGDFVVQAKPFYLKASSAERENI